MFRIYETVRESIMKDSEIKANSDTNRTPPHKFGIIYFSFTHNERTYS